MTIDIIYKTGVRHAYARAQRDGSIKVTIPRRLRHDTVLRERIVAKAQNLRQRVKQNQKFVHHDQKTLIFGEYISIPQVTKLDTYLSQLLTDYIQPLVDVYALRLGYQYTQIRIKKLRAKRGSCSYDQKLVFNRDLVHVPLPLVRYVIAHEICHLQHKHHQTSFRQTVAQFYPDYKSARRELKQYQFVHAQ